MWVIGQRVGAKAAPAAAAAAAPTAAAPITAGPLLLSAQVGAIKDLCDLVFNAPEGEAQAAACSQQAQPLSAHCLLFVTSTRHVCSARSLRHSMPCWPHAMHDLQQHQVTCKHSFSRPFCYRTQPTCASHCVHSMGLLLLRVHTADSGSSPAVSNILPAGNAPPV